MSFDPKTSMWQSDPDFHSPKYRAKGTGDDVQVNDSLPGNTFDWFDEAISANVEAPGGPSVLWPGLPPSLYVGFSSC
jgi:hypothetical protein